MLTQSDIIAYLSKGGLPQNEIYQILHAYVYSKLSRGALPSEAQAKIFSIHRKLIIYATTGRTTTDFGVSSPTGRAFEAIKTQMALVSRKYLSQGVNAFGKLGGVGSASGEAAIKAWTKATDGQVTTFDDGSRDVIAVDAGRFLNPVELAPPPYVPDSPDSASDPLPVVAVLSDAPITSADIELGRARLAALKEEANRRKLEELALAEQGMTTEERETAQANNSALRT